MVFYVCYGRVQVDICGVQFSAGKGSVFQIPRGELTLPITSTTIHLLTHFIWQAITTVSKTHMTRMPDYSSPNAVFQKEVKSPCKPRMQRRASLKLRAVPPKSQLQSLGVDLRASKRPNECFGSLFFFPLLLFRVSCAQLELVYVL